MIPQDLVQRFQLLVASAIDGTLALAESVDIKTGQSCYVLATVSPGALYPWGTLESEFVSQNAYRAPVIGQQIVTCVRQEDVEGAIAEGEVVQPPLVLPPFLEEQMRADHEAAMQAGEAAITMLDDCLTKPWSVTIETGSSEPGKATETLARFATEAECVAYLGEDHIDKALLFDGFYNILGPGEED